ncbi:MAG TPA: hypothetical protein VGB14_17430 [Acidimicrobiales bacterium]|jgi:hypothetical protein
MSTEALFVGALVLFAVRLGARPIADNSALLHLRTGVDLLGGLGLPSTDPYSWTAAGHPWVVQSWLAEAVAGLAHQAGGWALVVVLHAALYGATALVVARLARTGDAVRTLAAAGLALGIGIGFWTPRPFVYGLLALALLVTAAERERRPWWLVPLAWVWVNVHGSFVLGAGWLVLRAAGEALDGDRAAAGRRLRQLGAFAAGLAVAAVNPVGPRLLAFPLTAIERRDVLSTLIEWRSPDFSRPDALFALVFLAGAVVVLLRARLRWADTLPVAAFVAAGLLAQRNLPVAGVVAAPALGRALLAGGSAARPERTRAGGLVAVAMALVAAGLVASAWRGPHLDLARYPVAAAQWMDGEGLLGPAHRMAHDVGTGNYLAFRYGREARVFVDDRLDLYPEAVSHDVDALLAGTPAALDVLERRQVDVVLWRAGDDLPALLDLAGGWRTAYDDGDWVVLTRSPASSRGR